MRLEKGADQKNIGPDLGLFLSEMKAFRPFHRIALIDFLSGASFSSKMAHRTAELWTFENSMFDFGSCCKVLGHKTITTGFSSKNHAQRWHWRPKLPTRTDRQCRLEKYSGLSREPFSNRMGGVSSSGSSSSSSSTSSNSSEWQ